MKAVESMGIFGRPRHCNRHRQKSIFSILLIGCNTENGRLSPNRQGFVFFAMADC
jgi:hypothetical protein